MISYVKSKSRLVELASTVWEDIVPDEKLDDVLSEIFRWSLYTKGLDVVLECIGNAEGKHIIACSLWDKNGRSAMLPVIIPFDEYIYEFRVSLGSANDLKHYKCML